MIPVELRRGCPSLWLHDLSAVAISESKKELGKLITLQRRRATLDIESERKRSIGESTCKGRKVVMRNANVKRSTSAQNAPVSELEMVRQKNIERNNDFLKGLGVAVLKKEIASQIASQKPCEKKKRAKEIHSPGYLRRSSRSTIEATNAKLKTCAGLRSPMPEVSPTLLRIQKGGVKKLTAEERQQCLDYLKQRYLYKVLHDDEFLEDRVIESVGYEDKYDDWVVYTDHLDIKKRVHDGKKDSLQTYVANHFLDEMIYAFERNKKTTTIVIDESPKKPNKQRKRGSTSSPISLDESPKKPNKQRRRGSTSSPISLDESPKKPTTDDKVSSFAGIFTH
jgi:hypothetical protein